MDYFIFFLSLRYLPLALYLAHSSDERIKEDIEAWRRTIHTKYDNRGMLIWLMLTLRDLEEFRSVVYYRMGRKARLFRWLSGRGQYALAIRCNDIGGGFVVQHGHSTRIGAKKIGRNFQVWHNVTLGKKKSGGELPTIGDNVKICTGAIVLGGITIGDGATVGAGSIVLKDVPAGAIVAGNPAKIIRCE